MHPVTAKIKISVQYNLKPYERFCAFYSLFHFAISFIAFIFFNLNS